MFIAALFTTAKIPHYRRTDLQNVVVIHMEFYSAMKKNEILLITSKWMELENIFVSEVSQAQET
jgi:hypothetical protein